MNCLKCQKPIKANKPARHGLHEKCFTQWFNAPATAEFTSLQRRASGSAPNETSSLSHQNTSFFHGKFKKYSATLDGNSYILKMRQDDAPELPEVEYLCNQIGRLLGIPIAEFFYIDFNGEKTFVTKNFIKAGTPTDLQHLYHFRSDDQHSCKGIIEAIAKQTQRPNDVRIFIKTLLFDSLIGNHDRHGRNLGFIVTSKGSTLSPVYDNVSYLGLETGSMLEADFNPTGKINTSTTYEPSMKDYVKELILLGYRDELNEFKRDTDLNKILTLINDSHCSNAMKSALQRLFTKRFKELESELND